MEPLKITAKLLDGCIASTDLTLPLDAVLVSAWMKHNRWYRGGFARSGMPESEQMDIPLPLAKVNTEANGGKDWMWACSYAFGEPLFQPAPGYWNKRLDAQAAEEYVALKGKATVDIRSGRYKNYRVPLSYYVMSGRELSWYVVGDKGGLETLLEEITSLGKKRSIGYGRLRKSRRPLCLGWSIEFAAEDLSMARMIPDPAGEDYYAIRPPYFDPSTLRAGRWPSWAEGLACNYVREGFFART